MQKNPQSAIRNPQSNNAGISPEQALKYLELEEFSEMKVPVLNIFKNIPVWNFIGPTPIIGRE